MTRYQSNEGDYIMGKVNNVVFEKSYIRKIGLKNLGFCAAWFLVSAFLFLNGYWLEIMKFMQELPHSIFDGSNSAAKGPATIFSAIASAFTFGLQVGWVVLLPGSLIMILTGHCPRFLGRFMYFEPGDNADNKESKELTIQDVWAKNRPTGKDYSIDDKE